jgi:hypothetical protein
MTIKTFRRQAIALVLTAGFVVPMVASAQIGNNFGLNSITTNLGTNSLPKTIGLLINVVLGFLGLIAFIIILLGGFKWMVSQGEEGKIGEAKKLMGAGVVGLAIVLASWAIAQFVITRLATGTGVTG